MSTGFDDVDLREPLPDWLARPLAPALVDMQGSEPLALEFWYDSEGGQGSGGMLCVREVGGQGGSGMGVCRGAGEPALCVQIAGDLLQQHVFWESDGAWAQPRPRCPGHPHPAQARLLDGEPCWVCPRDGRRIATIGTLHS